MYYLPPLQFERVTVPDEGCTEASQHLPKSTVDFVKRLQLPTRTSTSSNQNDSSPQSTGSSICEKENKCWGASRLTSPSSMAAVAMATQPITPYRPCTSDQKSKNSSPLHHDQTNNNPSYSPSFDRNGALEMKFQPEDQMIKPKHEEVTYLPEGETKCQNFHSVKQNTIDYDSDVQSHSSEWDNQLVLSKGEDNFKQKNGSSLNNSPVLLNDRHTSFPSPIRHSKQSPQSHRPTECKISKSPVRKKSLSPVGKKIDSKKFWGNFDESIRAECPGQKSGNSHVQHTSHQPSQSPKSDYDSRKKEDAKSRDKKSIALMDLACKASYHKSDVKSSKVCMSPRSKTHPKSPRHDFKKTLESEENYVNFENSLHLKTLKECSTYDSCNPNSCTLTQNIPSHKKHFISKKEESPMQVYNHKSPSPTPNIPSTKKHSVTKREENPALSPSRHKNPPVKVKTELLTQSMSRKPYSSPTVSMSHTITNSVPLSNAIGVSSNSHTVSESPSTHTFQSTTHPFIDTKLQTVKVLPTISSISSTTVVFSSRLSDMGDSFESVEDSSNLLTSADHIFSKTKAGLYDSDDSSEGEEIGGSTNNTSFIIRKIYSPVRKHGRSHSEVQSNDQNKRRFEKTSEPSSEKDLPQILKK